MLSRELIGNDSDYVVSWVGVGGGVIKCLSEEMIFNLQSESEEGANQDKIRDRVL